MKKLHLYIFCIALILTTYFLYYKYKNSSSPILIPVTFNFNETPLIMAEIEGTLYPLQIDLGSKFPLTLSAKTLESIPKKPYGISEWRDAKGLSYNSPACVISKIKIGEFTLTDLITSQEDESSLANGTWWNDSKDGTRSADNYAGSIGRPLLEKTNLLLDFPHSIMFISNDIQKLTKEGFNFDKMVKIPCSIERGNIILKADSDGGTLRLFINTGATVSFVRTSRLAHQNCKEEKHGFLTFETSRFIIGGKDFGKMQLYLFDITPDLHEIDGCLGMDFLKKHVIYIDYSNKFVYIAGEDQHGW
jgi:hypothetical protein